MKAGLWVGQAVDRVFRQPSIPKQAWLLACFGLASEARPTIFELTQANWVLPETRIVTRSLNFTMRWGLRSRLLSTGERIGRGPPKVRSKKANQKSQRSSKHDPVQHTADIRTDPAEQRVLRLDELQRDSERNRDRDEFERLERCAPPLQHDARLELDCTCRRFPV